MVLAWRKIWAWVKTKPPIPVGILIAVIPILALGSAWIRPLSGIDSLPLWLKVAYFASLSYFVAATVCAAFCPEQIKLYRTGIERVQNERDAYERSNPSYRYNIVITQLGQNEQARIDLIRLAAERDAAIGEVRSQLDARINEIVNREWVNAVQQYLLRDYANEDLSCRMARAVCTFALAIFAAGVVVVLIHRTVLVVRG